MAETADIADEASVDKVESITLESLSGTISDLTRLVEQLARRPQAPTAEAGTMLPRAKTTKEILAGMRQGEKRQGQTRIGPAGMRTRFAPDDVIELTDVDKVKALQNAHELDPAEPIYGVVQAFMYARRRDGMPKYRVDFGRRLGDDGIMEDQMVPAQAT